MSDEMCFSQKFTTALDLYDGKCGPVVCEVRDATDPPLPPDVEDPIRYWTPICQRCLDAGVNGGKFQQRVPVGGGHGNGDALR